jgi:hypothetical protein
MIESSFYYAAMPHPERLSKGAAGALAIIQIGGL